ncbi:G-type lectin S-receptor-like serine/threonine-protein kinase LECRK2 isoform X1 [Asparagus officinalis]|uniref:G-type lectin S-receptor-like serine/threonine-protein kinase LECRK2 isoform X1 n=1 Tax=Asparagus officinalis TaxID=4686 RepID=UPI00098E57EF|nr:G-type lectin S-receptor-like serine/threonine-protein kinase LECRK2 isoform X1 [Asparagus officinalis]
MSSLFLRLLLFFLLSNFLSAQADTNITLGETLTPLTPPTSWLSPSGDFAFGFRPLESDPTQFLLAVFFNKVPNQTVVWTANGGKTTNNQSKAVFTQDGRLSLRDHAGNEIWNTSVTAATSAAMLDTGNFMLVSSNSSTLWQTFDNPTDTILPGQVLQEGTSLYARLTDSDYSRGRFELGVQPDGNLVLYSLAYPTAFRYRPAYWASNTWGSVHVQLVFGQSGKLYLARANNSELFTVSSVQITEDHFQRATLDSDGVFRHYTLLKNKLTTGSWDVQVSTPDNICESLQTDVGSGACGFNSYCTFDSDGRVNCQCPPKYSYLDPDNKYKGCKPDFISQSCEPGGEAPFDFVEMNNVDWQHSDVETLNPMNEAQCKDNCLKDCFCLVAVYSTETCRKKKFPLSNGNLGSSIQTNVFIKFSKYNNTNTNTIYLPSKSDNGKRNWKTLVLTASILLGSSVLLNLVVVSACVYKRKRRLLYRDPGGLVPSLCSFTYKELEFATKGFTEELGRGAFGTVYKGNIAYSESQTLIAVKKLGTLLEEAERDFTNEVNTIGQTHHKNLVRLLGFCKEGEHRLLVYEFMSNGSLSKYIFGMNCVEWTQRAQIAISIAEGLAYLHEECRKQIIHCDIKPQNILLDENNVARISDFGLAKLLRLEQTRTSTGIRGTIGYFAPEWFKNIAITTKVDVYSFGVVLLEIICCRRNFDWGLESQEKLTVIDWAKECYKNGRMDLLVEDDEEAKKDRLRLERFVLVGISCVQDEPWLRPSMKKVVQMLEGATEVSVPPNMYSIHLQQ